MVACCYYQILVLHRHVDHPLLEIEFRVHLIDQIHDLDFIILRKCDFPFIVGQASFNHMPEHDSSIAL